MAEKSLNAGRTIMHEQSKNRRRTDRRKGEWPYTLILAALVAAVLISVISAIHHF